MRGKTRQLLQEEALAWKKGRTLRREKEVCPGEAIPEGNPEVKTRWEVKKKSKS